MDDVSAGSGRPERRSRRGKKGTPIIYWKFEEERGVRGESGNLMKVQLERPRSFISYVFNGEQIEGLPPFLAEKPRECDVVRAEKLLEASGATIINRSQASAFYKKDQDTIYLPKKEQFPSEAMYYPRRYMNSDIGQGMSRA